MSRIDFHNLLVDILDSTNVYFQPPSNISMKYPCIVYSMAKPNVMFADGMLYNKKSGYEVTVIDRNPDSEIPDRLETLKYCSFDRAFVSDNLHHFTYTIYY